MNHWKQSLAELLRTHNRVRSGNSVAGAETQRKRAEVLFAGMRDLWALGYRVDPRGFRGKHMEVLARLWVERGLLPPTIQNNFSVFRVFATWIGKAGMIEATAKYVGTEHSRRTSINRADKSWPAQNVDVSQKIAEVQKIDERVAMQLELQEAFALRPSESMQLRPHLADRGAYLAVNWGTKGGRSRTEDIRTEHQREVLNRAKQFAARSNAGMCDPRLSLKAAKAHYYRVVRKCGISKAAAGITSYGLRHGHSNDRYKEITGVDSPVRGGGPVDPDLDDAARREIAEELGHSRPHITTYYLGRR